MGELSGIRGLIFDCDGLIVDTEPPAYRSWQDIYEEHGCSLPLEVWAACVGGTGKEFDPCAYLEQQIGRVIDRDGVRARRLRRKLELCGLEHALPGVLDYVAEAECIGLKRGVVSSSPRAWVIDHADLRLASLEDMTLTELIEQVVSIRARRESVFGTQ